MTFSSHEARGARQQGSQFGGSVGGAAARAGRWPMAAGPWTRPSTGPGRGGTSRRPRPGRRRARTSST
ncbi:hypothetical protein NKH18_50435 [Streptomyces sp. M10(2022)]